METLTDKTIRKNLDAFYEPVMMPGGYMFDHYETVRRINSYYDGKFISGEVDATGDRKYFFNISKPAVDVAVKFIDLDTKDFLLISEDPGIEHKLWFMRKDFKNWMKTNYFGEFINELAQKYPKGHIVIKKGKEGKWRNVNIENLRMKTTVSCLDESPFVYEVHEMTRDKMMDMSWDNVDEYLEIHKEDQDFIIYETYTKNEKGTWDRTIRTDVMQQIDKKKSVGADGKNRDKFIASQVLHEDIVDELPYRELKWENIPGRWLGLGFVELLFENQRRINEIVNLRAKALKFSALKLWQTQDDTGLKNMLIDAQNGDIIKTPSGINPIAMENRNLADFSQEEQAWNNNSSQKTFTFEVAKGELPPSGTTLGSVQIVTGMIFNFYKQKRENYGLFLKRVILDDVLPEFKLARKKMHSLRFTGSEMEMARIKQAVVETSLRKAIFDYIKKSGFIPDVNAIKEIKQKLFNKIEKKKEFVFDIIQGFYDDVKTDIDLVVTGESLNISSKIVSLQVALQTVASNPGVLQNKASRAIFFKMLELAGLSSVDLSMIEEQVQAQQVVDENRMPQGGQDVEKMAQGLPQSAQSALGAVNLNGISATQESL